MTLIRDGRHHDVHDASAGEFASDPTAVLQRWDEFRIWEADADLGDGLIVDQSELGSPIPLPGQVFGIGLNYRRHAIEAGLAIPSIPMVFTKFRSSITGPFGNVGVPTPMTDWEVELAVVIGRLARNCGVEEAWDHIAGVTLAQDFSARDLQMTPAGTPQFSLGKSFPGFLPMGPEMVTIDEIEHPDSISLRCDVDGVRFQDGNTDDLIFSVPEIIAFLSSVTTLSPGDVILTGTPAGVGMGQTPPRFLRPGEVVVSESDPIGSMRHTMIEPDQTWTWSR